MECQFSIANVDRQNICKNAILKSTSVKLTLGRAHDGMPAADSFGLPLLGGLALHHYLARGRGHLVDLGRHLLCQH